MNRSAEKKDLRIIVAAPASNSGKTAVACGLIALMKKKGYSTCAFKCGPDYIDPMFHRSVLGIKSSNLDVFLAGEDGVRKVYEEGCRGMEAVICEGVMGYYDGLSGSAAKASPWHLSTLLDIPSVIVIRPRGAALTIAAQIMGLARFRSPSNVAAVILNDCSRSFFERYATMLEEESGIPVIGYLPHIKEAEFGSRHLGLMTAGEIGDIRERIDRIADIMSETLDVEKLIQICGREPVKDLSRPELSAPERNEVPIAVARDEAFCFIYDEAIRSLEQAGGRIVFFSPLRDEKIPSEAAGLYLPGGYPELHGEKLSKNKTMLNSIKEAVQGGMPTIAECGGFLYLGQRLKDGEGRVHEMAGVLPGESENSGKLVRFGYGYISADSDSLLFRKGEMIPAHEFHYWDTTENGSDLELIKAGRDERWRFGYCTDTLYAGFPHLYMAGDSKLAGRFVEACGKINRCCL